MNNKKFTILMLSLFVMSLFIFSGCSAARKPGPTQTTPNQNQTNQSQTGTTTSQTEKMNTDKAARIAREADRVSGVKKSTVVVSGNKAYIGLDINSNIQKTKTKAVEDEVIKKIKGIEPSIKTVYVSSDVAWVTRIKKVSQGISTGKPISSFTSELGEIGRRLTPRTM